MHKAVKDMKVIELEKIEAFLDQQVIMEKEHRKMRRALLELRKGFSDATTGAYLIEDVTRVTRVINAALKRIK